MSGFLVGLGFFYTVLDRAIKLNKKHIYLGDFLIDYGLKYYLN